MAGMRLTAQEARDLLNIKKESFEKTLSIIRQMADSSVQDVSRRGHSEVKFDVPLLVWGRDSYDQGTMGKALAEQLFEDGFDVTGTTSRLIISWKVAPVGEQTQPIASPRPKAPVKEIKSPPRSPMFTFLSQGRDTSCTQKKKKVERRVNISSL